ncbi:MAG TPA: DivIVA domain-containing protein [Streptosporangiaceae bacterium]
MSWNFAKPARLTPGRVRSVTFRLARLGRRGFDEDDVRDFCDRVEDEISLLLEERAALQGEVRRLRGWVQARNRPGTGPVLPLSAPVGESPASLPHGSGLIPGPRPQDRDVHGQALRILAKAQQTAERYVSDAHAYSREVAHEAQRRRERILAEASARATILLDQAHQAAIRSAPSAGYGTVAARHSRPAAAHRDPASRADPGPAHESGGAPTYDLPPSYDAGPRSYPVPPADYSTVIDYPGPAADYHSPRPPHRDPPRRDTPRHDRDRGHDRDRNRGHHSGESQFPF